MSTRRVDEYAAQHGISNKEAKRRLGRRRLRSETTPLNLPERGKPVAGTGKPKGAKS